MIITDETIKLVPIKLDHAKAILLHFDHEINQYMTPSVSTTVEQAKNVILNGLAQIKAKTDLIFAIEINKTHEFIGLCGLHNLKTDYPHIGLWLKKEAHGHGIGKIVTKLLLKQAQDLGLKSVLYEADYRNLASCKIALFYQGELIKSQIKLVTPDKRELYMNTYLINLK